MKLSDIMVMDAMVPNLQGKTRDEAIKELVAAMGQAGAIEASRVDEVSKAVLARERQATTGIGKGVALPHAKLKDLDHPIACIGRSVDGIDFSSLDSKPVYSVILLLSNPENPDEHLEAMEAIFNHVQRDMFRKFLRQAETVEAMADLIEEADEMG